MDKLENKVIVYDDACPMCKAYTSSFVKIGWLKKRSGFTNASPEMLAKLDLDRARHEIPLLDTDTGEVHYGLDALFLIFGTRMPIFKPLFRSKIFRAPLFQLYQLITFNRRIIAASVAPKAGFNCAPDVNVFYRWVYIILATGTGTFLLLPDALQNWWGRSLLIAHGLLLLVGLSLHRRLDFLGHWATVILVTGLLLWIFPNSWWVYGGLLLLTAWMWRQRWPQVQ